MFMKKFLGCVPLRAGNIVLAYAGIVVSVAIMVFYTRVSLQCTITYTQLKDTISSLPIDQREKDIKMLKLSEDAVFVMAVALAYNLVFILFMIFSILLAIGAHEKHRGCISAYFIYGIFHTFCGVGLGTAHFFMEHGHGFSNHFLGGLTLAAQFVYVFCLCGVMGLYNSVQDGKINSVRI